MTHGRTQAVVARVPTANDHDMLVFGADVTAVTEAAVKQAASIRAEEVHREMHTLQMPTRNRQITRTGRTGRQHDRIKVLQQLTAGYISTDRHAGEKGNAFLLHNSHAAVHHLLLVELHIWNAVHQQSAHAIITLVNRDEVAGFVELSRCGETSRAGSDNRDLFTGSLLRRLGDHPAHLKAMIDDCTFDCFNGYRRICDAKAARAFAGRRADPPGEFRKIVGAVQSIQRIAPATLIDQIVPFRDQVVDRAARGHVGHHVTGVAERYATVHAPGALNLQVHLRKMLVKLLPVQNPQHWLTVRRHLA